MPIQSTIPPREKNNISNVGFHYPRRRSNYEESKEKNEKDAKVYRVNAISEGLKFRVHTSVFRLLSF
jgi:hypothetical protein